ncbi:unnamed protein product [Victoria cruziana]
MIGFPAAFGEIELLGICLFSISGSRETLNKKKFKGVHTRAFSDALYQLVSIMEESEYWELGIKEFQEDLEVLVKEPATKKPKPISAEEQ